MSFDDLSFFSLFNFIISLDQPASLPFIIDCNSIPCFTITDSSWYLTKMLKFSTIMIYNWSISECLNGQHQKGEKN